MGKKLHKRMNGEQIKIHQHDNYQMPGAYKQDGDKNKNQPMFKMAKPYSMGVSMRGPLDKHGMHKGPDMHGKKHDGPSKYMDHKGPNKMDPMYNGKPGVQKEDFEQFKSPNEMGHKKGGPEMRGPLNQNPCPDGKAWDKERKGCYPSKKEQAKMKTKMVKKMETKKQKQ